MKKFINSLKSNKYTCIILIAFVFLIIICYGAYKFLFPNIGRPVYGNRLDGIENVEITNNQMKELEKKLNESEFVKTCSSSLSGRTFNVIITVNDDTSSDNAKSLTEIVKASLEKEQQEYFDIQVFIKKEGEEKEGFPIIGYLGKTETAFSFSSN